MSDRSSTDDSVINRALANPIGGISCREFLSGSKRCTVIVNDATRSTPTALMLDALEPVLSTIDSVEVLVATGLHTPPGDDQLERILGSAAGRYPFVAHAGFTESEIVRIRNGGDTVHLNKRLFAADRVVILTSVEPHFFAGFTGGWKSIVPGLAGFETVQKSHSFAMSESAVPMAVDGNPVREYIDGTSKGATNGIAVYSLQAVLDSGGAVAGCYAGDVDECFRQASIEAAAWHGVSVAGEYDVVVAVMWPPLDANLYQLQKAWENTSRVLATGGGMITVSACREGLGSSIYRERLQENPNIDQWAGLADQTYKMGAHKLVRTARLRARATVYAVTDMDDREVAMAGYVPRATVQQAIDTFSAHRKSGRILIVDDAGVTVPVTS